MHKRIVLGIVVIILLAAAWSAWRWLGGEAQPQSAWPLERALDRLDALAGQFPSPQDETLEWPGAHGAKWEQFAEAWLFAGRVRDEHGQSFGFQLAFERIALRAGTPERVSAWATQHVFRARFLVEPAGERPRSGERISRAALGLAGAGNSPATAWLEDWRFTRDEGYDAFHLQAGEAGTVMTLRLHAPDSTPIAIEGPRYRGYWWPGLAVEGTLELDGRSIKVAGEGLLDRLWGRGLPLGRGQLALARLWFDLGEGVAIRCERLHRRGGGGTPLLECVGRPDGPADGVRLDPAEHGWQTLAGARIPLGWQLRLPAEAGVMEFSPLSMAPRTALDGSWRGVLMVADEVAPWGLAELSNYAAP
jgi:predicted secreted hydrolase